MIVSSSAKFMETFFQWIASAMPFNIINDMDDEEECTLKGL